MGSRVILKTIFFVFLALTIETRAYGYTAADYTNAGLKVYAQKNYALAIRYFTAALAIQPADARALQGRANCYYFLAQYQPALVDYEKLLAQNPSGPVSQFVQALRTKMGSAPPPTSPVVVAPVSGSAGSPATAPALGGLAVTAPTKPAGLGLRVEPIYFTMNLSDFSADANTLQADAAYTKTTDPTYTFDFSVPTDFVGVAVEPVAQLGGGLEVGLPFCVMPVGKVTETSQNATQYNDARSYAISAFSVGLNLRYVFGSGPVRPFIAGGGLLVPITISLTDIVNYPSNPTSSTSGDFSGMAIGGQGQVGVDFHIGDPFVLSLFGGYQLASANSFKGSVTTSGSGPTTTDNGQLGVFDDTNGKKIIFSDGSFAPPPGFRSLEINLSGVMGGIHLSVYF